MDILNSKYDANCDMNNLDSSKIFDKFYLTQISDVFLSLINYLSLFSDNNISQYRV